MVNLLAHTKYCLSFLCYLSPPRCLIPTDKPDPALAKWVSQQRAQQAQGRLAEDRKTKLDEIDFSWKLNTVKNRNTKTEDKKWQRQYEKLVAFKQEHSHCKVPDRCKFVVCCCSVLSIQFNGCCILFDNAAQPILLGKSNLSFSPNNLFFFFTEQTSRTSLLEPGSKSSALLTLAINSKKTERSCWMSWALSGGLPTRLMEKSGTKCTFVWLVFVSCRLEISYSRLQLTAKFPLTRTRCPLIYTTGFKSSRITRKPTERKWRFPRLTSIVLLCFQLLTHFS